LCRHVYTTNFVREIAVEFGFSWFVGKVMIEFFGQGIRKIVVKVEIVGW
jgi:hypothetical protein